MSEADKAYFWDSEEELVEGYKAPRQPTATLHVRVHQEDFYEVSPTRLCYSSTSKAVSCVFRVLDMLPF